MNEIEMFALEQIKAIAPVFSGIEFEGKVWDTGRMMTFFLTIDGKRYQCYKLADDGIVKEDALESVFEAIALFIRQSKGYKKGEVKTVKFEA
jgi:hypothetical protein